MPVIPVTTTAYLMRNDRPVPVKVTGVFSFTRVGDLDSYRSQHILYAMISFLGLRDYTLLSLGK